MAAELAATAGSERLAATAGRLRHNKMKTSDMGSRYGCKSATRLFFKMSDSESVAGLVSLASSPDHSCGLGLPAASDDDAAGNEDRSVPVVVCLASPDLSVCYTH